MSRCLVTGGAGFIGSHVADRLVADGHEVIIIDNLSLGKRENINANAEFHELDLRDYEAIKPLFTGVEVVFHLAADPRLAVSVDNPQLTNSINVVGTLNVLQAARSAQVRRVVFSSSCAVYGDQPLPISEQALPRPLSPYGLEKLIGEQYCQLFAKLYGLQTVCLRYFNVFGSRKTADGGYPMVIPIFLEQRRQGQALTITGDGEQTRDYVHVRDVVNANIKAWEAGFTQGEVFNIGSGRQTSVNEIAGLIGGDSTHLDPRPGEMRFIEADVRLARTALGWQPTVSLLEGIDELKREHGLN